MFESEDIANTTIDTGLDSIKISNIEKIFDILFEICPYGKVAVLSLKESFISLGLNFITRLKISQFKVISVILEKYQTLETKNVIELLNLPEDVRVVVVLDYELCDLSLYLCSINKTPILFYSQECLFNGGLDDLVFIKNGEFLDKVNVYCDKWFFLDYKIDKLQLIISLGNTILSILEYIFNKLEDRFIDQPIEQIITKIEQFIDVIEKNQTADIIKQFVNITILLIKSGVNHCVTTSKLCCFVLNCNFNQVENAFLFANNIINRISDNLYKISNKNLRIIDYNLITEKISKEFNLNRKQILQNLTKEKLQIRNLTKRTDYIDGKLIKLRQLINRVYDIYKEFNGKQQWKTAKIDSTISIAGFLNGSTPLLQFFREFDFE